MINRIFSLSLFLACFYFSPAQWDKIGPPGNVVLYDAQIFSSTQIHAIGDSLFYTTTDAGSSWTTYSMPIVGTEFYCLDPMNIFCVGDGRMFCSSTDGGQSWSVPLQVGNVSGEVDALYFYDATLGFAIDHYAAEQFRTTDGGQTWSQLSVPVASPNVCISGDITDKVITFLDSVHGFWAHNDTLFESFDAGISWSPKLADTLPNSIAGVQFMDNKNGVAVGAQIFSTSDGGQNWTLKSGSTCATAFDFPDVNTGYAANCNLVPTSTFVGELHKTYDGANSWGEVCPPECSVAANNNGLTGSCMKVLDFVDADIGIAITGEQGSGGWLYYTTVGSVGIEDSKLSENDFQIFPNPASDEIFLDLNTVVKNGNIEILDLQGKIIARQEQGRIAAGERFRIGLEGISPGMYLLRIKHEGAVLSRKFVIRR